MTVLQAHTRPENITAGWKRHKKKFKMITSE